MTTYQCNKCSEKYAFKSSADRCCTEKAKKIEREFVPKPRIYKIKFILTPEERKRRYEANREEILRKQRIRDRNKKKK